MADRVNCLDSSYCNINGDPVVHSREYSQLYQPKIDEQTLLTVHHLDHGASTLPPTELLTRCARDFATSAYVNPHSSSAIGKATGLRIANVRQRLAKFFGSDLEDYSVIFTGNTTKALELVANCIQLRHTCLTPSCRNRSVFAHLQESHTSVLGMRQIAASKGAFVTHVAGTDLQSELINIHAIAKSNVARNAAVSVNTDCAEGCACSPVSILVFPAQCNFTGRKYPVRRWLSEARSLSRDGSRWLVCVDASGFAATSPLSLSSMGEPDFVAVSFYKIFGYPTGLGALLVRNYVFSQKQSVSITSSNNYAELIREPVFSKTHFYGGGAVAVVASTENYVVLRSHVFDDDRQEKPVVVGDVLSCHEAFEDGTLPFYEILSVGHALDVFADIYRGTADAADRSSFMRKVSKHTFELAATGYALLKQLRHAVTDLPLVEFYCGIAKPFDDIEKHGGAFSFNLRDAQGNYIGYSSVANLLDSMNIIVRTGCFCNIGACQANLGLTAEQIRANYEAGHTCGDAVDLINGRPTGAVRVSFGACSVLLDVVALVEAVSRNYVFSSTSGRRTYELCGRLKKILNSSERVENYSTRIGQALEEIKVFSLAEEKPEESYAVMPSAEFVGQKQLQQYKLSKMYLFPVKSCRAYQIPRSWPLSATGLLYDRRWILLQENGKALDQRSNSALAFIQPHVHLGEHTLDFEHVLTGVQVKMPLNDDCERSSETQTAATKSEVDHKFSCIQSRVCGDRVALRVFDQSAPLDKFFAHVFCGDENNDAVDNTKIRLAQQSGKRKRTKDGENQVSLANQAQYLLVTTASLLALSEFLEQNTGETFSCEDLELRFRPNLVIDSDHDRYSQPFVEETWKRIRIGNIWFEVTGPCTRCTAIAVDPNSGTSDSIMMQALCQLRGGKLQFGVYLNRSDNPAGNITEPFTSSEPNFGELCIDDDVKVCCSS